MGLYNIWTPFIRTFTVYFHLLSLLLKFNLERLPFAIMSLIRRVEFTGKSAACNIENKFKMHSIS